MTAEAHADAVKALLGSVRVYDDGLVPDNPTLPYAILWFGGGDRSRTTLAAVSDRRDCEFQITSVGLDETGMRSVQDRAAAALVDQRPVVAGRQTSPIWQVGDTSPQVDRDVTPHRLYVADRYAFTSVPAPS